MHHPFDPIAKLRHLLHVLAFCLAISAIQYAFNPERVFGPMLVYSLAIGLCTWAPIDFGRHWFRSAAETGWPRGAGGIALVVGGIVIGYFAGNFIGDTLCRFYGWTKVPGAGTGNDLRNSILITGLAGIAGSYYFYSAHRGVYLERMMAEARSHAAEARLKLLETQLEPHMLFNTLANLRALIAVSPDAAIDMLDRLNDYLRATLSASRAATHSLGAEADRLVDYLELMKIRMGPRLTYTLDVPEALRGCAVPPLLLQPIVENSIKHGLEPKVEGGRIALRAWREGGQLMLEVRDTGVGFDGPAPSERGFGLTQVRERLATAYGEKAGIAFSAVPGEGATTLLHLPCAP